MLKHPHGGEGEKKPWLLWPSTAQKRFLSPFFRLISWTGRKIDPVGVDYILQKLGFHHARTTIPKWLQRGVMDPLDKVLSVLIKKLGTALQDEKEKKGRDKEEHWARGKLWEICETLYLQTQEQAKVHTLVTYTHLYLWKSAQATSRSVWSVLHQLLFSVYFDNVSIMIGLL